MKDVKIFYLATLGLCAILTAGCENETPEAPEVARPVRILTISSLQGGEVFSYPGKIQGAQNADLAFEVSGRLVELPAEEGIEVTQGQLLAKLDPADYQSALNAARAEYNSAKATFDRNEKVFKRGLISAQDIDLRRRQFKVAQAQLASARKAVNDTELHAPFSGRVGRTYVDNFNNVQAKQPILLLQDLTQLEVVVDMPEQDWRFAKLGMTRAQQSERVKPVVSLSMFPNRTFPASVNELSAAADPVTRTFAVHLRFDPPDDLAIMPGMSATVTITISDIESLSQLVQIPANAIVGGDDGRSYVWKVDEENMTVHLAPVSAGKLSGSQISIVEGLAAGDRIAVSGIQHLAEGMKIREFED
jgi:RND family efflux transporter MFP subunit